MIQETGEVVFLIFHHIAKRKFLLEFGYLKAGLICRLEILIALGMESKVRNCDVDTRDGKYKVQGNLFQNSLLETVFHQADSGTSLISWIAGHVLTLDSRDRVITNGSQHPRDCMPLHWSRPKMLSLRI